MTEWVERLRPDAERTAAARGARSPLPAVDRAARVGARQVAPATCAGASRCSSSTRASSAPCLPAAGYDDATVERVQSIVRKEELANDAEVQALEDALCLVFLETQLTDVAARLDPDTLTRVVIRTANKMSDAGRAAIADVPLERPRTRDPRRARSAATSSSAISPVSRAQRLGRRRRDARAGCRAHGSVPRRVPRTRRRTRSSSRRRSARCAGYELDIDRVHRRRRRS